MYPHFSPFSSVLPRFPRFPRFPKLRWVGECGGGELTGLYRSAKCGFGLCLSRGPDILGLYWARHSVGRGYVAWCSFVEEEV